MSRIVASEMMQEALVDAEQTGRRISHWVVNQAGEMAIASDPRFSSELPGVAYLDRPYFGYRLAYDPFDNSREPRIELVFET